MSFKVFWMLGQLCFWIITFKINNIPKKVSDKLSSRFNRLSLNILYVKIRAFLLLEKVVSEKEIIVKSILSTLIQL